MLTDLLYDFVCRTFGLSALIPPPVSYTYKTKRVEKGWRSLLVRQLYVKIIRRRNLSNFCVVYIVCRRCLSTFLPLQEKNRMVIVFLSPFIGVQKNGPGVSSIQQIEALMPKYPLGGNRTWQFISGKKYA